MVSANSLFPAVLGTVVVNAILGASATPTSEQKVSGSLCIPLPCLG